MITVNSWCSLHGSSRVLTVHAQLSKKERKKELRPKAWVKERNGLSSARLHARRLPQRAAGWATVGTAPNQACEEETTKR